MERSAMTEKNVNRSVMTGKCNNKSRNGTQRNDGKNVNRSVMTGKCNNKSRNETKCNDGTHKEPQVERYSAQLAGGTPSDNSEARKFRRVRLHLRLFGLTLCVSQFYRCVCVGLFAQNPNPGGFVLTARNNFLSVRRKRG